MNNEAILSASSYPGAGDTQHRHLANQLRRREDRSVARDHGGTVEQAQWFLSVTHQAGPQMEAFYHLELGYRGAEDRTVLLAKAGVKPIQFHGLRHTCATLLLQERVPAYVVQERLGHKKIEITLGIYAHVAMYSTLFPEDAKSIFRYAIWGSYRWSVRVSGRCANSPGLNPRAGVQTPPIHD